MVAVAGRNHPISGCQPQTKTILGEFFSVKKIKSAAIFGDIYQSVPELWQARKRQCRS